MTNYVQQLGTNFGYEAVYSIKVSTLNSHIKRLMHLEDSHVGKEIDTMGDVSEHDPSFKAYLYDRKIYPSLGLKVPKEEKGKYQKNPPLEFRVPLRRGHFYPEGAAAGQSIKIRDWTLILKVQLDLVGLGRDLSLERDQIPHEMLEKFEQLTSADLTVEAMILNFENAHRVENSSVDFGSNPPDPAQRELFEQLIRDHIDRVKGKEHAWIFGGYGAVEGDGDSEGNPETVTGGTMGAASSPGSKTYITDDVIFYFLTTKDFHVRSEPVDMDNFMITQMMCDKGLKDRARAWITFSYPLFLRGLLERSICKGLTWRRGDVESGVVRADFSDIGGRSGQLAIGVAKGDNSFSFTHTVDQAGEFREERQTVRLEMRYRITAHVTTRFEMIADNDDFDFISTRLYSKETSIHPLYVSTQDLNDRDADWVTYGYSEWHETNTDEAIARAVLESVPHQFAQAVIEVMINFAWSIRKEFDLAQERLKNWHQFQLEGFTGLTGGVILPIEQGAMRVANARFANNKMMFLCTPNDVFEMKTNEWFEESF